MWEISPAYMQACLQQVYEYDETIHAFMIKTSVEKLSGEENSAEEITEQEQATEKKKPEKKKKKKYKPVALKVHSVPATLPEEFRIVRRYPSDPLEGMPPLNPHLPKEFVPGKRLSEERLKKMNLNPNGFLWDEEERLFIDVVKNHELAFTWDDSERGHFRKDYFDPVRIPVLAHTPWQQRNIPVPPGIRDQVVQIIKNKIASGVYEPSSSSYRSSWFCVPKAEKGAL